MGGGDDRRLYYSTNNNNNDNKIAILYYFLFKIPLPNGYRQQNNRSSPPRWSHRLFLLSSITADCYWLVVV
jgi:hypothetical protein